MIAIFLNVASDPNMLVGAATLVIAAAALLIMANVLKALGSMSVEDIAKAIGAMAVVLLVLVVAGIALEAALPGLLGLGAAVLLIGAGIFLASIGIGLFVMGIALLVSALAAGGAMIATTLVALSEKLPLIATNIAKGIGAFAIGLVDQQTALTSAMVSLFNVVIDAMTKALPKILGFINLLVTGVLQLMVTLTPKIITATMIMFKAFMDALQKNMPAIATQAGDIIVGFINALGNADVKIIKAGANFIIKLVRGIGDQALRIADAAMKTVIKFINGLTTAINKNGKAFDTAVKGLIDAIFSRAKALVTTGEYAFDKIAGHIIDGLTSGLQAGIDAVVKAVGGVIGAAYQAAKDAGWIKSPSKLFAKIGVWLNQGIAGGIDTSAAEVASAARNVITATYSAMQAANDAANNIILGMENPTIKPVIDLDSVYAGAKTISSLMGNKSSIQVAATVSGRLETAAKTPAPATDAANTKPTEVTLIQHNTSPKALSRMEIYRQTHNQLQVLKGFGF
jgi:hypothetical protein